MFLRGKRLRRLAKRKGLRYRFKIWKRFVKSKHDRNIEDYSVELDRKIAKLIQLNNMITNQDKVSFFIVLPTVVHCNE
jgi:hypothetical protein